jgi:hypothetical protein
MLQLFHMISHTGSYRSSMFLQNIPAEFNCIDSYRLCMDPGYFQNGMANLLAQHKKIR